MLALRLTAPTLSALSLLAGATPLRREAANGDLAKAPVLDARAPANTGTQTAQTSQQAPTAGSGTLKPTTTRTKIARSLQTPGPTFGHLSTTVSINVSQTHQKRAVETTPDALVHADGLLSPSPTAKTTSSTKPGTSSPKPTAHTKRAAEIVPTLLRARGLLSPSPTAKTTSSTKPGTAGPKPTVHTKRAAETDAPAVELA